jgi:hypothetical protein
VCVRESVGVCVRESVGVCAVLLVFQGAACVLLY